MSSAKKPPGGKPGAKGAEAPPAYSSVLEEAFPAWSDASAAGFAKEAGSNAGGCLIRTLDVMLVAAVAIHPRARLH